MQTVKKALKTKIAIISAAILAPYILILILFMFLMPSGGGLGQIQQIQKQEPFTDALNGAIKIYTETGVDFCEILAAYILSSGSMDKYDLDLMNHLGDIAKNHGDFKDVVASEKDYKVLLECYKNSYSGMTGTYTDEKADSKGNGKKETEYFYYNWYFPIASGINHYEEKKEKGKDGIEEKMETKTTESAKCSYSNDFLDPRSFGDVTFHDGNDVVTDEGTPIIAIESGTIETIGWNNAGGWRIGIRSLDGKRFWYYAHMRKFHPYCSKLSKGASVDAGEVIGYVGSTGYSYAVPVDSMPENSNAVDTNFIKHLHIGLRVKMPIDGKEDGEKEDWVDPYPVLKFLEGNKVEVDDKPDSKDYMAVEKKNEERTFANMKAEK